MLSRLFSAAFVGLEALEIEIEIDLKREEKQVVRLIGLPDMAMREAKDRVLLALKNSGHHLSGIDCTIHLAPAELKKAGAFYDLPIALGMLHSAHLLESSNLSDYLIGGELGLGGEVRPICGALGMALLAKNLGRKGIVLPKMNAEEATLVQGVEVIAVSHLKEAITFFRHGTKPTFIAPSLEFKPATPSVDFAEVKGQVFAKRAFEIAAAGRHNILLSGPPGSGKTMLAKAFCGILPELDLEEALEVTNIHSLAGLTSEIIASRPFRSPHHTVSYAGMLGGGAHPKPGEVSLAHRGVLFLDELPEFSRSTLEVLRQPLEDGHVTVSRASGKLTFPTNFICVAAMNPCPCGFLGHPDKPCRDSQSQIDRYQQKISGPLLDRIDLHLNVAPVKYSEMAANRAENSATVRKRVKEARSFAKKHPILQRDETCEPLIREAMEVMGLSARGHKRVIDVAQTIACLEQSERITSDHLMEALSYRKH